MKKYIILAAVSVLALPSLAAATSIATPVQTSIASAPTTQIFSATLKKGTTNADVSTLQTMLKTDPVIYPAGLVTGYYGAATEAAVKNLQKKYSLPVTGIVDSATQEVLYPNPYTTNVSISVIAPNGGEIWNAGNTVQVLWKSTVSPIESVPTPEPLPTPMLMMNGSAATGAGGSAGIASTNVIVSKPISSDANIAIMPPPFFNYASIDLVRDGDPSYSYHIGSVNLYDSRYSWTVPKKIPEASDYRVRISIGNNVPCMYTNDVQMMKPAGVSSIAPMPPCATKMITSSFASDTSDKVFSIKGGVSVDIGNIRSQIAQIKAMLEKLSAQVADIESQLEGL